MKYLLEFRQFFINEGGNAFPDAKSIDQADVLPAFNKFKAEIVQIFGGPEPELIGSWRQKAVSGDLDTLVYSDLSLEEISNKLQGLGFETRVFYGFNIVSVKFEIAPGHFAQFDMFIRPLDINREINDLFYKSPDNERYSTKHRVFLLFAALDSMKFDKLEQDGKVKSFKGYMLRPDGLYEFTKELKRLNYSIVGKQKLTDDIDKISEILFGKVYPYQKWNTFEQTLALLDNNPELDMPAILAEYRKKLENEGLRIPAEIS
jgi:hypothetical protein